MSAAPGFCLPTAFDDHCAACELSRGASLPSRYRWAAANSSAPAPSVSFFAGSGPIACRDGSDRGPASEGFLLTLESGAMLETAAGCRSSSGLGCETSFACASGGKEVLGEDTTLGRADDPARD